MNILVFNHGSSSLKCCIYRFNHAPASYTPPYWEAHEPNVAKLLTSPPVKIDVIGHRIVHGGSHFHESVLIDAEVKKTIALCADLAPLHNTGAEKIIDLCGDIPQVAVFDTAFHHTIPDAAAVYPGPYRWLESGIRRYGFHGISFQYCSKRAAELLHRDPKMVICHLGSGASLCAIKHGKSIDTTMGFTPLEGLMMDTRCGSIDPGILLYLLKKNPRIDLSKELYRNSGLLGLSGISEDMRDILKSSTPRAALTLDVYIHRLVSCLGSMITSLRGIDTLVFTAGIGENAPLIRQRACEALAFLGLKIDSHKNQTLTEDGLFSTQESAIQALLIHTHEEFEIARECWRLKN